MSEEKTGSTNLLRDLEAVLFASGSPVELERLCEIFGIFGDEAIEKLEELRVALDNADSGISLIRIGNAFQLCTKTESAEFVKKALELRKTPPLSKASLEVLAIIAYNQPVTRLFVEQVRGVDSSYIVNSLAEKGLVSESGRLDAPGRPSLFVTTDTFLRCFGLTSIADLPEVL